MYSIAFAVLMFMQHPSSFGQKKFYFSIETGFFTSNTNNNLKDAMIASGFNKYVTYGFFGFISTTRYPTVYTGNKRYRVRVGYQIKEGSVLEAGYSYSFGGNVYGADRMEQNGYDYLNFLNITSKVHTLSFNYILQTKKASAGIGAGPVFVFFNTEKQSQGLPVTTGTARENALHLAAGTMAFWNFINRKTWFAGIRADASFSGGHTISATDVVNTFDPTLVSHFKESRVGNFMGSINFAVGFRL